MKRREDDSSKLLYLNNLLKLDGYEVIKTSVIQRCAGLYLASDRVLRLAQRENP